jgi:UDP-glucose 4-epimerase
MKVVITGVGGFLGSHLADSFIAAGWQVTGIDNFLGGYKDNVPDQVDLFEVDLLDLELLKEPFANADLVIHTACTAYEGLSVFSPSLIVSNTIQATTNALTASIQNNVKKFVYLSSMARYGDKKGELFTEDMTPNPQDPYGIAKYGSELLVKNLCETHGVDWVILVPHNIIGPRQKYDDPYRNVASIFINRMLQGKQPIVYGKGESLRCFSFIQDVINPLMVACESPAAVGQIINIGPDEEHISIYDLAVKVAEILEFDLDPIFMPGRPQEVLIALCSSDKARELLGYKTGTDLSDGLKQLVEYIKGRGVKPFDYHLPLEIVSDKTPKTWSQRLM